MADHGWSWLVTGDTGKKGHVFGQQIWTANPLKEEAGEFPEDFDAIMICEDKIGENLQENMDCPHEVAHFVHP